VICTVIFNKTALYFKYLASRLDRKAVENTFSGHRIYNSICYNYSFNIDYRKHVWRHKLYSVSQKSTPGGGGCGLLTFFHKRLKILNQFLHFYYTFLSTLDYKFLFSYLQL